MQGPLSAYHDALLDLLRTAASMVRLPDVEFVLHLWDHPKVLRQDPIPVFGGVHSHGHHDVSFIHPYSFQVSPAREAVACEQPAGSQLPHTLSQPRSARVRVHACRPAK